jgi:hypothetical protein
MGVVRRIRTEGGHFSGADAHSGDKGTFIPFRALRSKAMDPIMFGGVILAFILAVGLVAAATHGPQGPGHLRVVGTVLLLAVAAFCIFGVLASYEPPGVPPIRIVYTLLGISSVIAAAWLATHRASSIGSSS